ncbi:BamA/OMP85 family outer membrane protein [Pseudoleptotrichia goodfellowii]|uniref:Surface antigen n=1 Tax=Pseudoleptotrichia goodfellowii TaxID=157692 RepID=A0A510J9X3_9FUSO|nr:BamA/TamA family outer membrane protein [Pseudoleptotrichia goodfellowii]BBM35211.1 surface antigen [Pseudoleptotrichia goodfellowii]
MKRKIYALIVTAALFLSVNGLVMAEGKDLRVGTIQFSHLNQLPEDFLMEKLPVKSGETYSNKSLSDIYLALKRLSYISNVNVYPKVEGDTVNLVIEVDEAGNALELAQREESAQDLSVKTEFKVSSVDISGIKTLNKEDFLKDIPVKVGEYFTPQDAINGAAKIFQSGYFSSVDPKVDRKTDNTISILYVVEENPAVQNVTIKGNTLFTQDELVKALGLKQGEVLNGNLLDPDRNGIIRHYSQAGYSLARIETIAVSPSGDINIELTEGIVDSVSFKKVSSKKDNERTSESSANLRTKPYVFERSQAVKPGEVFETKNVEATIRELYRTGVFTSIEPVLSGKENDPNARVVEFLVEERPTTTINGSISYGTSVGLVGGIKLSDSNFLGKGQEAAFNIEASNKGDKTVELSLFDPWIRGTERVQGGGSIYWKESVDDDAASNEVEKVRKIGTRWTIGKGLNDKIFVRGSLRFDHYKEILGSKEINDKYNLVAVSPTLVYDSRDNAFAPTKGIYSTLSYEFGDLIRDSRKYSQFEADLRGYHRTFFKDKNVMAYRVVWGSTGSGTPEALRFSIGGAETLRGYDYGKYDGFNKFHATIENRTQVNKYIQLVAFFDIGNAWQNVTTVNGKKVYSPNRKDANGFKDLKKGVGIGVRLNTPIGPLRFDYGWPLDPEEKGGKKTGGKFYFSFGQTF